MTKHGLRYIKSGSTIKCRECLKSAYKTTVDIIIGTELKSAHFEKTDGSPIVTGERIHCPYCKHEMGHYFGQMNSWEHPNG